LPVPPGLSSIEAAALPEALVTIYANVFEHGALKPGEIFVTHGANSGIGAMAIQMAKAAGATVIATARGPKKAAFARELGADVAVDLLSERFEDAAKALGGAHLILEMVGGDAFAANIDAVRLGGRIVVIGRMSHAATSLPLARLMQKQAVITGSLLRPRSTEEKGRLVSALEERFWPVVSGGGIKAMIDCVYPLAEVAAAHSRLRSGAHMGKIVLTCS
jgi:NADPH:quinone reductase-like Zn-dependent oxidoreductase